MLLYNVAMSAEHVKVANEILSTIRYATVATCTLGAKPWNSPVAIFYDDQMNIYWFSDKGSTHSKNIRQNKHIFIVIYDSTVAEGMGEGVYIEATAKEVNDLNEVAFVAQLQIGTLRVEPEQCQEKAIHRFYKATPSRAWINDDENDANGKYIRDIRVELSLSELKG